MANGASAAITELDDRLPAAAERLQRGLFHVVLRLILAVIAVSEWVVIARLLGRWGAAFGAADHALAIVAIYGVNHLLVRRVRTGRRGRLVSVYAAFAFTSFFGAVVIGAAKAVWSALRVTAPPGAAFATFLPALDPARWQPVFDTVVDTALLATAALFVFGYTHGRRALAVTGRVVTVPDLPSAFAGFRIVHLSDLHMGAYLDREELAAHVARVNDLVPDLVCITGDLVDHASTCTEWLPVLARLRARHGVLVTLGNHDVAAGAEAVTTALRTLTPFSVLRNARVDVARDGAVLTIVGVDDLGRDWARGVLEHPALPALVREVPADRPLVVLSHRPDCFEQAAALGAHLVLAGHTHGGQIGLPGLGGRIRNIAEVITRYDRGTFRSGAATLVVSNGLGFTGQPVRLFTPREIGCLELRRA